MQQWEHAVFDWEGEGFGAIRQVWFSDGETWAKIPGGMEGYTGTPHRLGELGYEMVSVVGEPPLNGLNRHVVFMKRPLAG